jgi:hypothetical protein
MSILPVFGCPDKGLSVFSPMDRKGIGEAGLCEGNELSSSASRYAARQLSSTLYIVYWQDTSVLLPEMNLPVHLGIATL